MTAKPVATAAGVLPGVPSTSARSGHGACRGGRRWRNTDVGEAFGDFGIDRQRSGDVGIAIRGVTPALFGQAPAIERRRYLRVECERGVVIGDCLVERAEAEPNKAAAVQP